MAHFIQMPPRMSQLERSRVNISLWRNCADPRDFSPSFFFRFFSSYAFSLFLTVHYAFVALLLLYGSPETSAQGAIEFPLARSNPRHCWFCAVWKSEGNFERYWGRAAKPLTRPPTHCCSVRWFNIFHIFFWGGGVLRAMSGFRGLGFEMMS